MKLFAIRDESAEVQKDLAYLLYYELEKRFYIELPENADPWELPLLLDSFMKQNETTVNSYWSKIWVQQRIIPTDRQNIAEILRDDYRGATIVDFLTPSQFISVLLLAGGLVLLAIELYVDNRKAKVAEGIALVADGEAPAKAAEEAETVTPTETPEGESHE